MRWNRLSSEAITIGQKILILDITQRKMIDIPYQTDRGEIRETDTLTNVEFWLDSPSFTLKDGVLKLFANLGYGMVNSPVVWLTGRSIGGVSKNRIEKTEAFVDCATGLFLDGIKTLGVCGKVASGLDGYNAFRKTRQYQLNKDIGKGWQKEAGKKFQRAKRHFQMYNETDWFNTGLEGGLSIWDELNKKSDEW